MNNSLDLKRSINTFYFKKNLSHRIADTGTIVFKILTGRLKRKKLGSRWKGKSLYIK